MNRLTEYGITPEIQAEWSQLRSTGHTETRGYGFIVAAAVLGTIAFMVVGARMWLRVIHQRKADASDWLMFFTLIPTGIFLVAACLAVKVWGFDTHMWNLKPQQMTRMLQSFYVLCHLYLLDSAAIKISIVLFYSRFIFHASMKWYRLAIRLVVAGIIITWFALEIALFFTCRPLPAFWNRLNPAYRANNTFSCYDEGVFITVVSAISMAQDVGISLMPLMLLKDLHLNHRRKYAAWFLGCLVFVTSGASAVRIYYVQHIFIGENLQHYDFSWATFHVIAWTFLELSLGLICASAPALNVLFSRFFDEGAGGRSNIIWQSNGIVENADELLRQSSIVDPESARRGREDSVWSVSTAIGRIKVTVLGKSDVPPDAPVELQHEVGPVGEGTGTR